MYLILFLVLSVFASCYDFIDKLFLDVNTYIVKNKKAILENAVFPRQVTYKLLVNRQFVEHREYISFPFNCIDPKIDHIYFRAYRENSIHYIEIKSADNTDNIYKVNITPLLSDAKNITILGIGPTSVVVIIEHSDTSKETLKLYYKDENAGIIADVDSIRMEELNSLFSSNSLVAISKYQVLPLKLSVDRPRFKERHKNIAVVRISTLPDGAVYKRIYKYLVPKQKKLVINNIKAFFLSQDIFVSKQVRENHNRIIIMGTLTQNRQRKLLGPDLYQYISDIGSIVDRLNLDRIVLSIVIYKDGSYLDSENGIKISIKFVSDREAVSFRQDLVVYSHNIFISNEKDKAPINIIDVN